MFKPAVLFFIFFLFCCVFFLASSSSNCDPFLISMSSWLSQQIINIAYKPSISTPAILPRVSRKAEWQGELEFGGEEGRKLRTGALRLSRMALRGSCVCLHRE